MKYMSSIYNSSIHLRSLDPMIQINTNNNLYWDNFRFVNGPVASAISTNALKSFCYSSPVFHS